MSSHLPQGLLTGVDEEESDMHGVSWASGRDYDEEVQKDRSLATTGNRRYSYATNELCEILLNLYSVKNESYSYLFRWLNGSFRKKRVCAHIYASSQGGTRVLIQIKILK